MSNSFVMFDEEIAELELIIMRHRICGDDIVELAYRAARLADLGKSYDIYSEPPERPKITHDDLERFDEKLKTLTIGTEVMVYVSLDARVIGYNDLGNAVYVELTGVTGDVDSQCLKLEKPIPIRYIQIKSEAVA